MRRLLLLAPLAAALAACNTGFEPQYRVRDLRVLALRSNPSGSTSADVAPGDTVELAALVANPLGRAGLTVEWIACLPQASDAIPPCLDQAWLSDPARLFAAPGTVPGVVSLGTGAHVTFGLPDVTAALEFVVATARLKPTFTCRLYAELVVVARATAEGHDSLAYKRVPIRPTAGQIAAGGVTDNYVLNLNPTVGEVRVGPSDPDTCTGGQLVATPPFPAGATELCGRGGNGSIGAYNLCDPGGGTTSAFENLDWQWYVTAGEFPDEGGGVGDARGGHVKFQRPASAFTIWSIVRDGRGGVDWAEFAIPAQ
jgi:hypothetical protein